ncbi:MAG TPA: acetyl/propionyl/methylcrotonyl-CoA carboxylase subunit alpha [Alphaproteobacteria bacterium]
MFERILIANRGEIACRIIDTARRLGVRTVALYSDADAGARHVRLADEAYPIGKAPAADSYLRIESVIEVARHAGAEAVHPGYGFLAENPSLAEACAVAGLAFIGPSADAIRAMGAKDRAKQLMEQAGVPVVPGYHEHSRDLKVLTTQARLIGFPILVKAVAGGGGRGMRTVSRELDLAEAIAAARREAQAAFGDDRVLLEKVVARARHVEIQVFADGHGNIVHLYERDCSIQRRHQKVIEEAPSPALSPELRLAMGEAAVRAAEAIGYLGAGTVEFLLDSSGGFHFMEMNTRLQVEHPVTEMITGLDLVEWQLRVAAGEPLPLAQDQIELFGHALEARLYAEDPRKEFLPSTGRLVHLRLPGVPGASPAGARVPVRIDTGVDQGDEVTPYYDPLIAKIVVWGRDRAEALRRMTRALADTELVGPATNLEFLSAVVGHPAFVANEVDTGFVLRHREELVAEPAPAPALALALAALYLLLDRRRRTAAEAARTADPYTPWAGADGWRLNDAAHETVTLIDNGAPVPVEVRTDRRGTRLVLPDGEVGARASFTADGRLSAAVGGIAVTVSVIDHVDARGERQLTVIVQDATYRLGVEDPLAVAAHQDAEGGQLTAPMPGRVTQVLAEDGARVARGAPLLVIEAMKMEHTVAAPASGQVTKVKYAVGDWVGEGESLLDFVAEDGGG